MTTCWILLRSLRTCLFPALILSFLYGCTGTQNTTTEFEKGIPNNAYLIKLYSSKEPRELYRAIYKKLTFWEYVMIEEDKKKGYLSTDYNEVASDDDVARGTLLNITVQVEAHTEGSVALFKGTWGVGGMDSLNNEAVYSGFGRSKDAFRELALIAGRIKHVKIEYIAD